MGLDRSAALERMASETFDVVVVGGGVTGCGVALDAAARGLRTALVEARDLGSGTSSKSSKLVHGGLRYLQQHDYRLVYEALHERQRLIRNAPHLVHPLPFLIPLFGKDGAVSKSVAKAYSAALWLYDLTGGLRIGHRHRRISRTEALEHFPVLRTDRLVASFLYWDAQADDARLTLALARTAAEQGAAIANYSPVVGLLSDEAGLVKGVSLADGTEVRARVIINAAGVWSEEIERLGGAPSALAIRPAKGIHVTVPAYRLPCDFASVLAVPGDRRSVFVVPWAADEADGPEGRTRYTYIGTTDTDYDGPLEDPACTAEDIEYVLKAVNAWTSANLTPADVTATWAGLRPLISDAGSARTADLSRRHRVVTGRNGIVTVTGGKLTTYRRMAADAVDVAVSRLGRGRRHSPTSSLPLAGGGKGPKPDADLTARAGRLGIDDAVLRHLFGRHGSITAEILDLVKADNSLAQPLSPKLPYIRAEVLHAARSEMALTVTDVLARRTRALILDREAARRAAPVVAELMGNELGWDQQQRVNLVGQFEAVVDAELLAERFPSSTTATA